MDCPRSQVRGKAVMVRIVGTLVEMLVEPRGGRHQGHCENLDEGKPDQGGEYPMPAGLVHFRFHAGRRLSQGGGITRNISGSCHRASRQIQ